MVAETPETASLSHPIVRRSALHHCARQRTAPIDRTHSVTSDTATVSLHRIVRISFSKSPASVPMTIEVMDWNAVATDQAFAALRIARPSLAGIRHGAVRRLGYGFAGLGPRTKGHRSGRSGVGLLDPGRVCGLAASAGRYDADTRSPVRV